VTHFYSPKGGLQMNEVEHLSFKTINVFVERGFLEETLKLILTNLKILSKEDQIEFSQIFKKYVTVLGFRNPKQAPLPLQVKAYATAFEEKEEVIPFTLSTWTKIKGDLANAVVKWLKSENWDDLTLVRNFDEDQGFKNDWPDDLSLDTVIKDFQKDHADMEVSKDDLALMILWVSGRLPN
jgi:hypothetical protein